MWAGEEGGGNRKYLDSSIVESKVLHKRQEFLELILFKFN